jgi:predicted outer membrane protein
MLVHRITMATAIVGSISMIAASAFAQDQAQRYQVEKPVIGSMPGELNSADSQLAACLIVDNQGEIALGKLAEQKAKDKDVKDFGEKMVQDHTQFMQQLERFASTQGQKGNLGANPQSANEAVQQQAAGNTDRALPGAMTQPMGGQGLNFVALKQEIGQKCLQMTQGDLEKKDASQFDKCYIGQQIGAHVQVLATLEVFRNQASPELASVLDKGIETTNSHLEHAKKIAESLDQQASSTAEKDAANRR